MSTPIGVRLGKNLTASALFGVAAVQIVMGGFEFFFYMGEVGLLDTLLIFSGVLYLALGIAARWLRLPAAVIGAVLYSVILWVQASRRTDELGSSLLIEIPIVILLVVAVVFAIKRPGNAGGEERVES